VAGIIEPLASHDGGGERPDASSTAWAAPATDVLAFADSFEPE
jgi:hypothetical protein